MINLFFFRNLNFRKRIFKAIVFLMFFLITSCENKSKIKLGHVLDSSLNKKDNIQNTYSNSNFVSIDSVIKSANNLNYQLIFNSNGTKNKIYEIENQDNSIEFKKKYSFKPLGYFCYEINDLPTGLAWDILFNIKHNTFYLTEKYDIHAIGDTLDRKSVDFSKGTAKVFSTAEKNRIYNIKLKRIW